MSIHEIYSTFSTGSHGFCQAVQTSDASKLACQKSRESLIMLILRKNSNPPGKTKRSGNIEADHETLPCDFFS